MGVQVPPAAPKIKMIKFINKIIKKFLLIILLKIILFGQLLAQNFYDYPMFFLVDACQITQQRNNPNKIVLTKENN